MEKLEKSLFHNKRTIVEYREAFQQGALACREGLSFEHCPWTDNEFRKQAWRDGWESAMTWVLEKAYS